MKLSALRHGREFVRHVVPAIIKPARTLWNEVIGFLFLAFAAMFGLKTFRYAMDLREVLTAGADNTGELIRLGMAGFCTVVMGAYGISSFRRARKISRS